MTTEKSRLGCVTLLVVLMVECFLIVALNVIVILIFTKNRCLRRCGMYLVVNLAIADALFGGVSGTITFVNFGQSCNMWEHGGSSYRGNTSFTLSWFWYLFPVASLANLALISIERAHATFRPFQHRTITKRAYGMIITANWVLAALLSASLVSIFNGYKDYAWNSFNIFFLFVICACYAGVVAKTCCRTFPQHHAAVNRERKLTKTLLIVSMISLLMWLPFTVGAFLFRVTDVLTSLPSLGVFWLNYACIIFSYGNSLVNPILYAIKMPGFRRALITFMGLGNNRQIRPSFHLKVGQN